MTIPNSVLFGNGLNRVGESQLEWTELINKIKAPNEFINGKLPNTFVYERALFQKDSLQDIKELEKKIKVYISDLLKDIKVNKLYQNLLDLNFYNYITTNYDNIFLNYILKDGKFHSQSTNKESTYSLRRKESIFENNNKERCRIWNIHGSIKRPSSIMLGIDHYCKSVSKIDDYVNGKYEFNGINKKSNKKLTDKIMNVDFDDYSWVELFFNSNIHIVGFSLDYCEIDLWWIINKRARLLRDNRFKNSLKNKVYFYDSCIDPEKEGLLKSLNVEVIKTEREDCKDAWMNYYYSVFENIHSGNF